MEHKNNSYFPINVQDYHDYLQVGLPGDVFEKYRRAYIRNISYSLQYLEFLNHSITAFNQHVVINNQLIKTFVITGCSIVESMLWILLKAKDLNKKISWKEIERRETNKYHKNEEDYKFEVVHYEKLKESIDAEMKFSDMCKSAEKRKLLGVSSDVYAKLNHLRKLRNRVHIHDVQHDQDNDYWVFDVDDYNLMTTVLAALLRTEIFAPHTNYDFIFHWLEIIEFI